MASACFGSRGLGGGRGGVGRGGWGFVGGRGGGWGGFGGGGLGVGRRKGKQNSRLHGYSEPHGALVLGSSAFLVQGPTLCCDVVNGVLEQPSKWGSTAHVEKSVENQQCKVSFGLLEQFSGHAFNQNGWT